MPLCSCWMLRVVSRTSCSADIKNKKTYRQKTSYKVASWQIAFLNIINFVLSKGFGYKSNTLLDKSIVNDLRYHELVITCSQTSNIHVLIVNPKSSEAYLGFETWGPNLHERRRRENRSAEDAEGDGVWGGMSPPQRGKKNYFWSSNSAFWWILRCKILFFFAILEFMR